jgi:hypothetical protein
MIQDPDVQFNPSFVTSFLGCRKDSGGGAYYKTFYSRIKLECLLFLFTLHLSVLVSGNAGAYHKNGIPKGTPLWWARSLVVYQSVVIKELHSDGRLLALPANRLV